MVLPESSVECLAKIAMTTLLGETQRCIYCAIIIRCGAFFLTLASR
jgi:hypothetical protein